MKYILYNIKKNNLDFVKESDVMNNLYYLKMIIPTKKIIENHIKENKNSNINNYFKKKDIDLELKKLKDNISRIEGDIPLYDINYNNLYLINKYNIYNRVVKNNYRFPDNNLIKKIIIKK